MSPNLPTLYLAPAPTFKNMWLQLQPLKVFGFNSSFCFLKYLAAAPASALVLSSLSFLVIHYLENKKIIISYMHANLDSSQ